jgi:hypothetical protein
MMDLRNRARLSRRNLLGGLAVAGGLAAVAMAASKTAIVSRSTSLARAVLGGRARRVALASAEMEDWQAAVGMNFGIADYLTMRLIGVRPLNSDGDRPAGLRRTAFVAVFELPAYEQLPGDLVYTISNPTYGAIDLFLSECAERNPHRLKAIIN